MKERTLIVLKHDTIQRGLIGKILERFENTGLKIIAMKMVWADDKRARDHYPIDEDWAKKTFEKTKVGYERDGKKVPYRDHNDFASNLQNWLVDFLTEGPVIAAVLEGPHAIELTRKLLGSTEPRQAAPGTIRGDFASIESYAMTDAKKRVLRNLVHASDSLETAKKEIAVWFTKQELHDYKKDLDRHF